MKHKAALGVVATAGLAMFSMFFGSGNLVFPLSVGVKAQDGHTWAIFGLLLTGVLVPFLGLFGIILFDGDRKKYFECIGRGPALILTFCILGLLGPFGVIPRCILVSYGGIEAFAGGALSQPVFGIIFCIAIAFLIWQHHQVVPILGKILTPLLILGLIVLILAGIFSEGSPSGITNETNGALFKTGLTQGYQMMDLLAAFFFSATVVGFLHQRLKTLDTFSIEKLSVYAGLIGAGLLAAIYIAFSYLGSKFSGILVNIAPEQMLATIAGQTMGSAASGVTAITISLACVTTATVLAMLFAEFLSEEITGGRINRHWSIIITLGLSLIVAQSDFSSLTNTLGTILQVAYPALIALAISNIVFKLTDIKLGRILFWATLGIFLFLKMAVV